MKAHTWLRVFVSVVVCGCAVATYWSRIHPASPVHYQTVIVKQGDGYLSERQCRQIQIGDKQKDIRKKYGYPATSGNTDLVWTYPLRENHSLNCEVMWGTDDVNGVWLQIAS